MAHVTSTFVIDSWKETVALDTPEDAHKLVHTAIEKTFTGGITGKSVAQMIMGGARDGSAAYCGFEKLTVTVDGKSGTFLLHHNAAMWTRDGKPDGHASWTVMPSSGSGELAGIRGTAQIARAEDGTHTLSLDYELD